MPIAMYPGSFDPVTRGHLDIIKRSSRMFDKVIVAVLVNSAKQPLFAVEERVAMLRECCKDIPNVEVDSFNGLTVSFAKQKHATVMVRGLRAVTDFENEIQLAHTNFAMAPGIETVFLATAIKWSYLSSTIVAGGSPLRPGCFQVRAAQRRDRPHRQARSRGALNPNRIHSRTSALKINKLLNSLSDYFEKNIFGGYL